MLQLAPLARSLNCLAHAEARSETVVLDIGGTTIRVATFDSETGAHGPVRRTPTPNYLVHPGTPVDRLIDMLAESAGREITSVLAGARAQTIIVGYPGPVSPDGVAMRSPTILGGACTAALNVAALFRERWPDARVHVLNDLTCAGYSFVRAGYRNFCVVTVASGVGNKIFLDGRPCIGAHGYGGEIGHVKASPDPASPVSDLRDDLGELASGRGTVRIARVWAERRSPEFRASALAHLLDESSDHVWSRRLVAAFRAGDALARGIIESAAGPLAKALAHVHLAVGVERFFITGGFATALGEEYRRMLVRMMCESAWDVGQDWDSMVVLSDVDCEDGLLGACYLASTLRDVHSARSCNVRA